MSLQTQMVAIVEAISDGRRSPRVYAPPRQTDYDLLAADLGKLGWTNADLQLFSDERALARAAPDKVCQLVYDWFAAQLAISDGEVQQRLLVEFVAARRGRLSASAEIARGLLDLCAVAVNGAHGTHAAGFTSRASVSPESRHGWIASGDAFVEAKLRGRFGADPSTGAEARPAGPDWRIDNLVASPCISVQEIEL